MSHWTDRALFTQCLLSLAIVLWRCRDSSSGIPPPSPEMVQRAPVVVRGHSPLSGAVCRAAAQDCSLPEGGTQHLAPGGCARPYLPGPNPDAPERFSNWRMFLQGEEEHLKEFGGFATCSFSSQTLHPTGSFLSRRDRDCTVGNTSGPQPPCQG